MRKRIRWLLIAAILAALLIPYPTAADDGGSLFYTAVLYEITDRHTMWTEEGVDGYLIGTEVKLLLWEVYNDVVFVPSDE